MLDVDPDELFAAAWTLGPRGLATLDVPEALQELAASEADDGPPSGPVPEGEFGRALGSVGGGNHFGEISEVEDVRLPDLARGAGLVRGGLVVLVHTGSRRTEQRLAAEAAPPVVDGPTGLGAAGSARSLHVNKANRSHDASASFPPPRVRTRRTR